MYSNKKIRKQITDLQNRLDKYYKYELFEYNNEVMLEHYIEDEKEDFHDIFYINPFIYDIDKSKDMPDRHKDIIPDLLQKIEKKIPLSDPIQNKDNHENNNVLSSELKKIVPERYIQDYKKICQVELKYEDKLHKSIKGTPEKHINIESYRILKNIKKNYYEYHDKLLPKRQNIKNFENININIKSKHTLNVNIIIEFYKAYDSYLKHILQYEKKESENTFNEYIKYNKFEYSKKYFSNFFSKVKKCYYFIKFLIDKGVQENKIIKLLYKTNVSYTKLFKIKNEDYEDLKLFFIEKLEILNLLTKDIKDETPITLVNLGERTTKKNTLLSYIGTKHNYIPLIKDMLCIKKDTKIIDMFAGSCGISYGLKDIFPENKIIINDVNKFIINFYNQIKNNCENLIKRIKELNTDNNIKNYKILLNIINDINVNSIDKAATYYILNKIAYNGKIFYDKNSKINIHSYNKNKKNINLDNFDNFCSFLNRIEINNLCIFSNTDYYLDQINEGDIVILDPPYDILDVQNNHYMNNFTRKEQEQLFIFVEKIIQKKGKVLIFNGNTPFIKNLYKNFKMNIIESKTHINKNKNYNELLIHN